MTDIKTLLLLELRSFYGINKFLHTKDIKEKKRFKSLSIIWVFLIAMVFVYVGGLVYGLCTLGLAEIVPSYLVVISGAIIVFFGMFTAGNRIFALKGYDVLVSLPIKSAAVVISRFLGHYIADLILAAVIMLPGFAVYGYCIKPNLLFYVMAVFITVFVPAIPLVIATLFGTVITALTSGMKKKSLAQSIFSVLLVIGVMVLSFSAEGFTKNLTAEQFKDLAVTVGSALKEVYPPVILVSSAFSGNIVSMLIYAAVSVVITLAAVFVISKNFDFIVHRLLNFKAGHNYKVGKMESRSILKALWQREAKRYFASSIYVTNTIIGPILATIMAVALCFMGLDSITAEFPDNIDIVSVLPFVYSAVFCMANTSSVSVSMEGKQFNVVKSLPITSKQLFDSKILFNLSLMLPFFAVSQTALFIATKPTLMQFVWQLILPIFIMLFAVVFGITVNLKFHSFDWENEVTVVKQSTASALGGFAGPFLSGILGVAAFLVPNRFSDILKAVMCLILFAVTAALYKHNNRKKLIDL